MFTLKVTSTHLGFILRPQRQMRKQGDPDELFPPEDSTGQCLYVYHTDHTDSKRRLLMVIRKPEGKNTFSMVIHDLLRIWVQVCNGRQSLKYVSERLRLYMNFTLSRTVFAHLYSWNQAVKVLIPTKNNTIILERFTNDH